MTVLVGDFDGTIVRNVGHYRLKRAATPAKHSPYIRDISGLPEEVLVPVNDYEGNTGPRIGMLHGHLDSLGHFVPSAATEPVKLSNGQSIVPAFYYLDHQYSYREFRPPPTGEPSYLLTNVREKLKNGDPFLLEAFAFMSLGFHKDYGDRLQSTVLTRRGHDADELRKMFRLLRKEFRLGSEDWPLEAFINLSHPDDAEFSFSKGRYIQQLYYALSDRMMENHTVPHYLIVFENDRRLIKEFDEMFRRVSSSGVFNNPVVPVLVNLVEPEVFANPDGIHWDISPLAKVTKMSRVTLYRPNGKIERTDNLAHLYELVFGMAPNEAIRLLNAQMRNPFMCRQTLVEMGEREAG